MPVEPPAPGEVRIFPGAADFRRWLETNHDRARHLWVGHYKKGVPKPSMSYPQAVEEALCFGWIDGITRRIDDEVYAIRFTPRRKGSSWSAVNIGKVAELKAAGRMHPAGLRTFEERDRRRDASYSYERPPAELPPDMIARLKAEPLVWERWQTEQPSFRRQAVHWVTSAKRPETTERRFVALLEASRAGTRPKPFIVEHQEREGGGLS
jgi:uncharacterized protein YdeI (YjbR/CyaY-like superfamily)